MEMAAGSAAVIVILMWAGDRGRRTACKTATVLYVSEGIFLGSVILVLCNAALGFWCVNTPLNVFVDFVWERKGL